MSSNKTTRSGGIGVFGLLGVVFVTLKLLGKITWSWWWVTAPFWVGPAVLATIFAMMGVLAAIIKLMDAHERRKR